MIENIRAEAQVWDVVVVGTGIGGATIGFELARSGRRVLFCERGNQAVPGTGDGDYAECLQPGGLKAGPISDQRALLHGGRWTDIVEDRSTARTRTFTPFIGCGTGGSSALYGMAMERFFPADFEPTHVPAGAGSAPNGWPITYAELAPFYAQAEALYRVRGTADPLRSDRPQLMPPPPLSPSAAQLVGKLSAQGLHPYQLPLACEYVPGCTSCQGYLCACDCKNDSVRVALKPAIEQHGATLLDACQVVRLHQEGRNVTAVHCVRNGQALTVRAGVVVLAAGALQTPALLLQSGSPEAPQGLANSSGLVGRHLMRHLIDLYVVSLPGGEAMDNRRKEIAFNDFYAGDGGVRLGTVQSFGRLPPPEMIIQSLRHDPRQSPFAWARPLLGAISPVLQPFLARLIERLALVTIVEDLPRPENRVEPPTGAGQPLRIYYRTGDEERQRVARMRRLMQSALKPWSYRLIDERDNNQRIAHACGTCRFGDDPATSVLDRNCRAHDVDNLYVVDSSFFPSSGGTNPSLTIAANALRVASHLTGDSRC